jgi:hypothetical protein
MADLFVNRLFTSDSIPTILWTDRRLFIDIQADNSIVSVGRMLKSTLRHYFAVPGKSIRNASRKPLRFVVKLLSKHRFFGSLQVHSSHF